MQNDYYEDGVENMTTIKLGQTPTTINNTNVVYNTTSRTLTVTADIKDYMDNNTKGTNKYCIKINGKTYYGNSTGGEIFYAQDGKIQLTLKNITYNNINTIELVTGERYAYSSARTTTTAIKTVK